MNKSITPWAQNDSLFFTMLENGYGWQTLPYIFFKQNGFAVEMPELTVRSSITKASQYKDTIDLTVGGYRVEIKSRNLRFTSPVDWPQSRLPAFVDTCSKYDAHASQPLAYVFVSQITGAMVCTDGRLIASSRWGRQRAWDNVRNIEENFYTVDQQDLRTMEVLVDTLKKIAK